MSRDREVDEAIGRELAEGSWLRRTGNWIRENTITAGRFIVQSSKDVWQWLKDHPKTTIS